MGGGGCRRKRKPGQTADVQTIKFKGITNRVSEPHTRVCLKMSNRVCKLVAFLQGPPTTPTFGSSRGRLGLFALGANGA